jgi:hypothetical protein
MIVLRYHLTDGVSERHFSAALQYLYSWIEKGLSKVIAYTDLSLIETRRMLWLGVPSYLLAVFLSTIVLKAGAVLSPMIFVMITAFYTVLYSKLFAHAAMKRREKARVSFYLEAVTVQTAALAGVVAAHAI